MCLILFGYRCHPDYRLIIAANRDEFLDRPSEPLGCPFEDEQIFCGRDLRAGGTWLGVSTQGRIGAITNYRDPSLVRVAPPSRGGIIPGYLRSGETAAGYLGQFSRSGEDFSGFNLLLADNEELWYYSNVCGEMVCLEPGLYGLSNRFLDSDWPKVRRGRELFRQALQRPDLVDALLEVLTDTYRPAPDELPDTGVGPLWERILAPIFIQSDSYGTRCSSVLVSGYDGSFQFVEQTWDHQGGMVEPGERRKAGSAL